MPRQQLNDALWRRPSRRVVFMLVAILASARSSFADSPTFMTYRDLLGLTPEEVASAEMKILRIGPHYGGQIGPVRYWVNDSVENKPNIKDFYPFRRSGLDYWGERSSLDVVGIPSAQFRSIVAAVGSMPTIAAATGLLDPADGLEFAVVVRKPAVRGFAAMVPRSEMCSLFEKVRPLVADQSPASVPLEELAGYLECESPIHPSEVTDLTKVELGPMRPADKPGFFLMTAKITNTSTTAILPNPLSLVLTNIPYNVYIVNNVSRTQHFVGGADYVNVVVPPNGLAPGASTELLIKVMNKELYKTDFRTYVLAGPGVR